MTPGAIFHVTPHVLPGGAGILFSSRRGSAPNITFALHIRTPDGEVRELLSDAIGARYVSTGHLIYVVPDSGVFIRRFDPATLELGEEYYPVTETRLGTGGNTTFDLSLSGALVYVAEVEDATVSGARRTRTLAWVDVESGRETPIGIRDKDKRGFAQVRLSPDGTKALVSDFADIWTYDLSRDTLNPFRNTPDPEVLPLWIRNGTEVAFSWRRHGSHDIYTMMADGTGEPTLVQESVHSQFIESWSQDGSKFTYAEMGPGTGGGVGVGYLEGDTVISSELIVQTPAGWSAISPDDQWLAYASSESPGETQVHVKSFDTGEDWLISPDGGGQPIWARKEKALYYRNVSKMMRVRYETEPTFKPGIPEELWDRPGAISAMTTLTYDIHPDGDRFIVIQDQDQEEFADPVVDNVVLVFDFFEELKRIAPAEESR